MAIDIIVQNSIQAEARNSNDELIGSAIISPANNLIEVSDFDLLIKDQNNNVLNSSIEKSGVNIIKTINIPVANGVLFKMPTPIQYISYRNGDEGYKLQNGLFIPETPVFPKAIADLDYNIGSNYWFQLKYPLRVGSNSNVQRFVDVDGLQLFPSTNNKDKIVIDKLTGLGIIRDWQNAFTGMSGKNWNDSIDAAEAFSVIVNGVTYSDMHIPTLSECEAIFGSYLNRSAYYFQDPITLANLFIPNGWQATWTSTTVPATTARAFVFEAPTTTYRINAGFDKTTTGYANSIMVFDARNLITAP